MPTTNAGPSLRARLLGASRPLLSRLPRGGDRIIRIAGGDVPPGNPLRRVRMPCGAEMELDLRDRIQRQMYYFGVYERAETRLLRRHLRPGDTVLDIGAHVGYFTLLAASRVGPAGAVHGFEPFGDNAARLVRNLALNPTLRAEAHHVAVAEATGAESFAAPGDGAEQGWGRLSGGSEPGVGDVPTVSVDDFVGRRPGMPVDVVKIDVEGAEERVVAGMARTLAEKHPRLVILELNGPVLEAGGGGPEPVLSRMEHAGYAPRRILDGGRLEPATPGAPGWQTRVVNLAFVCRH